VTTAAAAAAGVGADDDDEEDDDAVAEAAGVEAALGGCEGVATCSPNPSTVTGRLMVNTA
jgi:hypothetical protein